MKMAVKWNPPAGGAVVIVCGDYRQLEAACQELFIEGADQLILEPVVEAKEEPVKI